MSIPSISIGSTVLLGAMMLNKAEPYTIVGGKHPVAFIQGGVAYDANESELGPCEPDGTLRPVAVAYSEPVAPVDDQRALLEVEADALGVKYRSNISTAKLRERVEAARNDAA